MLQANFVKLKKFIQNNWRHNFTNGYILVKYLFWTSGWVNGLEEKPIQEMSIHMYQHQNNKKSVWHFCEALSFSKHNKFSSYFRFLKKTFLFQLAFAKFKKTFFTCLFSKLAQNNIQNNWRHSFANVYILLVKSIFNFRLN